MQTTGFEVTSMSALGRNGDWRLSAPHANPMPELFIITRGQGRVTAAGRTRGFSAPTLFFMPARTMHSFDLSGPVVAICLRFPEQALAALPDDILFLRSLPATTLADITQLVHKLETELAAGDALSETAAVSYATLIAIMLHRLSADATDAPWVAGKALALVSRFTQMIETDLSTGVPEGVSVSTYADRLGITSTHLNRVCQTVAGKAASTLLQDRIVAEARLRLCDTHEPVQAIARSLGFRSPAYFSRAFGQRTGLTPSAARASGRAVDSPPAPHH